MRMGQTVGEPVQVPSMGVTVQLVPLTEAEVMAGFLWLQSLELRAMDGRAEHYVARRSVSHDVWTAMREPEDTGKKVYETLEEMESELDSSDIDFLAMELNVLMNYASPSLANMTEEELVNLKKACQDLPWNELTGSQAAAARIFITTLWPRLLPDNSLGSTSTESSMETSETS